MRRNIISQYKVDSLVCDDRAKGRCECGECSHHKGRCTASRGHTLYNLNKWVQLKAVTKDGSPLSMHLPNLIALCQNCLAEYRKDLVFKKNEEKENEGLFALPELKKKETPLL